jgi:hypothetical protein
LTQASADGLSLWNGTNWTLITNGLQSDDVLWTSATCGAERYAAARNGNIYRLQSGTMVRIATNGEAVAQGEFTTIPVLDCAPDGTLRVASGDALIARRAGNGWVEENYAPRHSAVHLSGENVGFAVGNGVVHRLNGGQWQRIRRVASGERLTGVATFANGGMIATGNLQPSIAMALRYDGTNFVLDTLPAYRSLEAIAPLGPGQALAVARTSSTVTTLLRYDNGWQNVGGGVANPVAVSTSAPDNGFVVGSGGAVARFNGSTFDARPSLPVTNLLSLALHALSPTEVFAASCGSVWRLAGSAWVDITPTVSGGVQCFRALFGTGATDMYVVVELKNDGAFERLHRLLRWDGTSWATLPSVPDSPDLRTGYAVPGRTVLTGATGYIGEGVPPGAARGGVRR